ncbi:MAG: hypothetical protein ACR2RE_18690 [Geminicoccaceae bacterium]
MFEILLILVAVVTAILSLRELGRLDRLAHEFRAYAQATDRASSDVLLAMAGHHALDKHQQILRTEALASCMSLLFFVLCLFAVVIISW